MNAKTLGILAAAAVALAVVATTMHQSDQPGGEETALGPLSPGLQEGVNRAQTLRISSGDAVMEFQRGEAGWTSPAHDGFPVMGERVREALIQLARLEKKDALTRDPARWAALQLEEPGPGSEARGVQILGDGDPLLDLVLGKDKWGASPGIYARLAGQDQTWLCDGRVSLPRTATEWMEKRVGQVPMTDVASVVLERGGATLSVNRPEQAEGAAAAGAVDWLLAELPEGRALATPNPLGRIAGALGWLSFDDVRQAASIPHDGEPAFVARYTTKSDQQVEIRGWEADGKTWCQLAASFVGVVEPETPEQEAEDPPEGAAQDEGPPVIETPKEDPQVKVDEWNGTWTGWFYSFPATTLDLWKSELEGLLEPLPEPEEMTEEVPEEPAVVLPEGEGGGQG
ncbi:MAG: DUF4340 domain-containing protein [Planctomycetes bacterium]|nr:DUF4340 domain-containing protein [Planctomycetota bacterium]